MYRDYKYLIGNQFAKGNKPNKTAFRAGQIPWNKGTKGLSKPNSGTFKKGNKGSRWRPVGTISIRKDKSGTRRRWIKIQEPNKWLEYAKFLWINAGRKLIVGCCLHHIDLNSSNDCIENLCLVSRKDHPKIHNRWNTKNRQEYIDLANKRLNKHQKRLAL